MVRLNLSTDKMLGAGADAEQVKIVEKASVGTLPFSIGYLAFMVITCIAISYADNDEVRSACGTGLREMVLAHTCFYFLIGFVLCFVSIPFICLSQSSPSLSLVYSSFISLALTLLFILGCVYSYRLSDNARNDDTCKEALQKYNNNMGSPLLAILGFVFFGFDVILTIVSFIVLCISLSMCFCVE
jgi:hypothetical protein